MRVRVAAITIAQQRVLLVSTKGSGPGFLVPPGGGVEVGEGLTEAVEREVREEAGLAVTAGPLLAARELQTDDGITLELYFGAQPVPGTTPEAATEGRDVRWVTPAELPSLPHFPEQLAALVKAAIAGEAGIALLPRADLRAQTDLAVTTGGTTHGE
jgi:ADP-ribose pyrophosphatase YjhB (NUDIX family)